MIPEPLLGESLSVKLPQMLDALRKKSPFILVSVSLLASIVIPMMLSISRNRGLMLLAALGGLVAILILLTWPSLGLVGIIGASMVVSFSVGTGTGTNINITVLLLALMLGLWILEMVARQRALRWLPSRTFLPLIGLVLVAGLAFGFGQLRWYSIPPAPITAQLGGLAIFLLSAGAFLLTAHQIKQFKSLQWMCWALMIVGGWFIVGRLVPAIGEVNYSVYQEGSLGSLFWLWLFVLSFSQAMFNRQMRPLWRVVTGTLALLVLYVSLGQLRSWVSGWLPQLLALGVILLLAWPRLFVALLPILAGIAVLKWGDISASVMVGDNEYSLMTRLEAWRILGEIVRVNPILGLGPANYYWYTPLFPILGYYASFNSHNNYVDIIAQIGLLGLALYFWLMIEVCREGLSLLRKAPAGSFVWAYAVGALGGLAGTLAAGMLGDWVFPFVYNIGLDGFRASVFGWLFLGSLIALRWMPLAVDGELNGIPKTRSENGDHNGN